jgi:hypothetical protein
MWGIFSLAKGVLASQEGLYAVIVGDERVAGAARR